MCLARKYDASLFLVIHCIEMFLFFDISEICIFLTETETELKHEEVTVLYHHPIGIILLLGHSFSRSCSMTVAVSSTIFTTEILW